MARSNSWSRPASPSEGGATLAERTPRPTSTWSRGRWGAPLRAPASNACCTCRTALSGAEVSVAIDRLLAPRYQPGAERVRIGRPRPSTGPLWTMATATVRPRTRRGGAHDGTVAHRAQRAGEARRVVLVDV